METLTKEEKETGYAFLLLVTIFCITCPNILTFTSVYRMLINKQLVK